MKRILVGHDGSAESALVLSRAIELAKAFHGSVRLVRVVAPPTTSPAPFVDPWPDHVAIALEGARAELTNVEQTIPETLRGGIEVDVGYVASVLASAAKRWPADILVIGAHIHGLLERLFGTTAAKLANGIGCELFVVRGPTSETPRAGKVTHAPDERAPDEKRVAVEAATLVGAAGGAAAGAMAGPLGLVVGGAVGAALGMVAGEAIEDADTEASTHERELDDAIGVTRGNIGAGAIARQSADALERGDVSADAGSDARAGQILRRDHTTLESVFEGLLETYRNGDWPTVQAEWCVFEEALRDHIDREERLAMPSFRAVDPDEAAFLSADHEKILARLSALGLAIELHAVPLADAEDFIAHLREHAAREEVLLYPWMDTSIAPASIDRHASAA